MPQRSKKSLKICAWVRGWYYNMSCSNTKLLDSTGFGIHQMAENKFCAFTKSGLFGLDE
jgi:hypothetical protein